MRISELGRRSRIPVPTIKYYLREQLLSYGEHTGPNQVHYDEEHVRRLALIRALIEVGGLSVATTRDVLRAVDAAGGDLFKALGAVQYAISASDSADQAVSEPVAELARRRGWELKARNPIGPALSGVVATLAELGHGEMLERLDAYAEQAERLAEIDVGLIDPDAETEEILRTMIVSSVLGDVLVSLLRRLAQEKLAARKLRDGRA